MKKYDVWAPVIAGKYLGRFEAMDEDEAINKALDSDTCHISVCHQCSSEISDPQIDDGKLHVEEVIDEKI